MSLEISIGTSGLSIEKWQGKLPIRTMTYVVDEGCIKCKTTDCVAVCPVYCFYKGENIPVIDPAQFNRLGVLEPR